MTDAYLRVNPVLQLLNFNISDINIATGLLLLLMWRKQVYVASYSIQLQLFSEQWMVYLET